MEQLQLQMKKERTLQENMVKDEKTVAAGVSDLFGSNDPIVLRKVGIQVDQIEAPFQPKKSAPPKEVQTVLTIQNVLLVDLFERYQDYGHCVTTEAVIKQLCLDYDLKFSVASNYRGVFRAGTSDLNVTDEIEKFCTKYKLKMDTIKFWIIAPETMLYTQGKWTKLAEAKRLKIEKLRPQCSVLLGEVSDGVYVPICTWGDHLSVFRCVRGWWKKNWVEFWWCQSIVSILGTVCFVAFWLSGGVFILDILVGIMGGVLAGAIQYVLIAIISMIKTGDISLPETNYYLTRWKKPL